MRYALFITFCVLYGAGWLLYEALQPGPPVYTEGVVDGFFVTPYEASSGKPPEDSVANSGTKPNLPIDNWNVQVTVAEGGANCPVAKEQYNALKKGDHVRIIYGEPIFGPSVCKDLQMPER